MKTIEVTDEQFEALKKIAGLLKTQNNRITAEPIWCIYERKRVVKPAGCGSESGWIIDGDLLSEEEANDLAEEWREDKENEAEDLTDGEIILDKLEGVGCDFSIEEVLVGEGQYYFTEEEAELHLRSNKHHYGDAFTYVQSAWRNPEWALIRAVLIQSRSFEK